MDRVRVLYFGGLFYKLPAVQHELLLFVRSFGRHFISPREDTQIEWIFVVRIMKTFLRTLSTYRRI